MTRRARFVFAINTLAISGLMSIAAHAQSSDPLSTTATKIKDEFNTLAPILITIGIIIGGLSIIFGHSDGWNRLGKVIIGGCIILAASWIATNFLGTTGG